MKIFIYKAAIISILAVIVFKLTISSFVKNYEKKFYENLNKEKVEYIKEKIRGELKSSIEKDQILDEEDAELINKFINRIIFELSLKKSN